MAHSKIIALLASVVLVVAALSCGTPRRSEPFKGPMEFTNSDVAQGHVVFNEHCQRCHPGGEAGLGPSLNDKPLPGFLIKTQVRKGLGTMPGFKKEQISGEQLRYLVKYIKALRKHG